MVEHRQGDRKATPLAEFAFDLNLSAVLLGDALRNGKAQARTRAEAGVFRPVEAVKDSGQIALGNTNAGIGHSDGHGAFIQGSNDFDFALSRCVFESVVQQDQKQLLQVVGVAPDERAFQRLHAPTLHDGRAFGWVSLAADIGHDIGYEDRFVGGCDGGVGAGQHEQLRHHASHTLGFHAHALLGVGLEVGVRCSYLPDEVEGGEHDGQGGA